jgi:hypothetical protein
MDNPTNKYNIWNKWDKLKTVMLGDCYSPDFFRDIKNKKIKSALQKISEETKEDLEYFESVLKDFGCEVLRPNLDNNDSIMNYINSDGSINGQQGVPRSPLQPRDCQLVIGNNLFYTGNDHPSIKEKLDSYCKVFDCVVQPVIPEKNFNGYRGKDAPDWPSYENYCYNQYYNIPISDNQDIIREFLEIHEIEKNSGRLSEFHTPAPSITVVGKDIYIDGIDLKDEREIVEFINFEKFKDFKEKYSDFRINTLNIGGHSDGSFHTVKEGAILSLHEIQTYQNTFPGWDVCYLPDQSWNKVSDFLKIKEKVSGKWWVPGQEDNDEFTYFVESWLQDWVGYAEETVFDVNVLVLDENHVCINNMNPTVVNFLRKHGMEAVHVPWRHRYFWDGGLHCITLDLYREGTQKDYFPERGDTPISDEGF